MVSGVTTSENLE